MPAQRLSEFDTWRPGYGLATVRVLRAGSQTLADIFTDEDLTAAASNPQTLTERVEDNISYGRWLAPLYTEQAYELEINSVDRTGVTRPGLTTLDGVNASEAVVTAEDGTQAIALEKRLGRAVDVRDYGVFLAVGEAGASVATNTTTLTNAIGAVASRGGGYVEVPSGTYQFSQITVSQGVVLRGYAQDATILQSTFAGQVVTLSGDRAGLARLTLDGSTQVSTSVGVYAEDRDEIVLDDVIIKRFDTGLSRKGGRACNWRNFSLSDCQTGYLGYGTENEGDLEFNRWAGGKVELCSAVGVSLKHDGGLSTDTVLAGVGFESNTGTALQIQGARNTRLKECWFEDNTVNFDINDVEPETDDNTVIGFLMDGGSVKDGEINLHGNLENVEFRRVDLQDLTIDLETPLHGVRAVDCREISGVTLSGTSTSWLRVKTSDSGSASGTTTTNGVTKAWAITLRHGQFALLEARVVARRIDGAARAVFHITSAAQRTGATLDYDGQTANFTVGSILTGATSGATGRIITDTDSGATGALTLYDVEGTFVDDEVISDDAGGSATANGALQEIDAELFKENFTVTIASPGVFTLDNHGLRSGDSVVLSTTGALPTGLEATTRYFVIATGLDDDNFQLAATPGGAAIDTSGSQSGTHSLSAVQHISAPRYSGNATNYRSVFAANGPQIELRVSGDTNHEVEWTVDVAVTSSQPVAS